MDCNESSSYAAAKLWDCSKTGIGSYAVGGVHVCSRCRKKEMKAILSRYREPTVKISFIPVFSTSSTGGAFIWLGNPIDFYIHTHEVLITMLEKSTHMYADSPGI